MKAQAANTVNLERVGGSLEHLLLSSPARMQADQMLQVQLQSSDLTWEEPPIARGQLMLQLGLRVAAVGRLLVLSVSSLYQGWRHKAVGGRGKV